jgi:hypothetical protein
MKLKLPRTGKTQETEVLKQDCKPASHLQQRKDCEPAYQRRKVCTRRFSPQYRERSAPNFLQRLWRGNAKLYTIAIHPCSAVSPSAFEPKFQPHKIPSSENILHCDHDRLFYHIDSTGQAVLLDRSSSCGRVCANLHP